MADNYLERQREQYEARKAAWLKNKQKLAIKKLIAEKAKKAESSTENK
jgi:hypothetical protein